MAITLNGTTGITTPALDSSGDVTFADNDKAIFGAGSDLQIYHDGSHSYIQDSGTGNLYLRSETYLALQDSAGNANYLFATNGGAVQLFHNNAAKLATTATGIDVTGTVVADGLTVDGSGGQVTTDNNGFIISKQLLDVETAGGRFIGKSNRGELGHIAIEQTATSADGGYIRFATSPAGSTTPADRMMIDSTGAVTMPYQPAFYATPSVAQTNITANDSAITVAMGTEIFDVGSNFASDAFTAPVTGKYQLNLSLYLTGVDTAASYIAVGIITSNRSYINIVAPKYASDPAYLTQNISTLADMDANDTAYVFYQQSGGAAQTDVQDDTRGSFFQGYLVA